MLLPTTPDALATRRFLADYETLKHRNSQLPPTLDSLLNLLGERDSQFAEKQDDVLRLLLWELQHEAPEMTSIQSWFLHAFRFGLRAMVGKFRSDKESMEETRNNVAWCFLETLHRIFKDNADLASSRLAWRILDHTHSRVRRCYGLDPDTRQRPEPMSELPQIAAPTASAYIHDLPRAITDEERYLLTGIYVYGYTQSEMAEKLGIKPEALRQRKRRIIKKIQEIEKR